MQRSSVAIVLDIRICVILEKELGNLYVASVRFPMQRSPVVSVPDIRICVVLEKYSGNCKASVLRRPASCDARCMVLIDPCPMNSHARHI